MARNVTKDFVRITFSLPKELVMRLKTIVEPGERSDFVGEAIEKQFKQPLVKQEKSWLQLAKEFREEHFPSGYKIDAVELIREERMLREKQILGIN